MRYWIKDEVDTAQGFPLYKLLDLILKQFGEVLCHLYLLRSQGYGEKVSTWDDLLDDNERLLVPVNEFIEHCKNEEEWFYDLDAELVSQDIKVRFGVHDSSALFIEGNDPTLRNILTSFEKVET